MSYSYKDITTPFIDYTMRFDDKLGLIYYDEEGKSNSIRFITIQDMIKSMKSKMMFYVNNNINHKIYEIVGDTLIIVYTIKDVLKEKAQLKCIKHKRCISFKKFSIQKAPTECGICNKEGSKTNRLYYMNICSAPYKQLPQHGFHLDCIQSHINNDKCESQIVCPCCKGRLNIEALESFYCQFINPNLNPISKSNPKHIVDNLEYSKVNSNKLQVKTLKIYL